METLYELTLHSRHTFEGLIIPQIAKLTAAAQKTLGSKYRTGCNFIEIRFRASRRSAGYTGAFLVLFTGLEKKGK